MTSRPGATVDGTPARLQEVAVENTVVTYILGRTALTGNYTHDILAAFAVGYADGVSSMSGDKI